MLRTGLPPTSRSPDVPLALQGRCSPRLGAQFVLTKPNRARRQPCGFRHSSDTAMAQRLRFTCGPQSPSPLVKLDVQQFVFFPDGFYNIDGYHRKSVAHLITIDELIFYSS
jgi:hypothetical protein